MGRRKISIQPISDARSRSVTFAKRKSGIYKKAFELAILADCEVSVTIYDRKRRLYVFSSHDFERTINHVNTTHIHEHQTGAQYIRKQRQTCVPRPSSFLPSLAAVNFPNSHHFNHTSSSSASSSAFSNPTCQTTSSQMRRDYEPMSLPANSYGYPYIKNETPYPYPYPIPTPTPTPTPTNINCAYEAQNHYSHMSPVKASPLETSHGPTFASSFNHMDTERSPVPLDNSRSFASTQPAYVDPKAGYSPSSFSDPMKTKLPGSFAPQPSIPEYHYSNQNRQDIGSFSTSSYPYPYQNFQRLPIWRRHSDHDHAYNVVPTPTSMYSMDSSHTLPDRLVPNVAHLPYS